MTIGKMLGTAFRIWLITVVINGLMIGFWTGEWGFAFVVTIVGTVISFPVPFVAYYSLKLAVAVSSSYASRFANAVFFLMVVAVVFWVILIDGLDGPDIFDAISRARELPLLIGSNFLSILIACFCSTGQLRKLDDVISEEPVIS